MNRIAFALVLSFLFAAPAFAAFKTDVVILEKADIAKLSDEKLTDAYTDVLVEIEAIKTFHTTSGFTPAQYDEYRNMLRYRYQLLMELHGRTIELPPQMER